MTLGAARVRWTINDLSMFVDAVVTGYVTMVIRAERGPVGLAKIISSMEEYRKIFGKKVSYTTDPLVVEMALRQGARLNLIRTAHYSDPADPTTLTAVASSVTLVDRGDDATPAVVESTEVGPFSFNQKLSGRFTGVEVGPFIFTEDLNDTLSFSVNSGTAQEVVFSGSMTTQAVVEAINAGTSGLTAMAVYDETSGNYVLKVYALNVAHSLGVSGNACDLLGITTGTYAANAGTDVLTLSIGGTADQSFTILPPTGTEGTFTLSASQVVARLVALIDDDDSPNEGLTSIINNEDKVRIATLATGTSQSIQVKSCTALTVFGFDTNEHTGTAGGTALDCMDIYASSPGDWGDDLGITITESSLHPDLFFNMRVTYSRQSDMNEFYADLSVDPTSDRYFVNVINDTSYLINVVDSFSANADPVNMPALGSFTPTGGNNGLENFEDSDWIGDAAAQTGIYAADTTYMSMDIMVPGTTSVTVFQALALYCENRGDMMAYGQCPAGNDPEDTVKWRMGEAPYTHPAFNSHRFSLWFARPLVFDDRDGAKRYVSCLGHLAACLCRTDNDYGSSYAPVGPKRGMVTLVEGIDFNIQSYRSTGYADLFAEYGINYLMISRMPGIEGAMFWEQRTTQRAPSATRELNVMRFITLVNRTLMPILRTYLFDPNHPVIWREIHRVLEPAFQDWKNKYAIYDFALQTDRDAFFDGGVLKNAVLNSGLDIDRGIYRCRALIQPTRAIYYLDFELGVLRTGEAFENYTSLKYLPGWIRH